MNPVKVLINLIIQLSMNIDYNKTSEKIKMI